MIGFYDYTVWLTYLSLISSSTGIVLCLNGIGHPYLGMFFLMLSGLCDAFDGKVARTKKNRTDAMKKFGIQIDSLSDLVAFGILPACIGIAMMRSSIEYTTFPGFLFIDMADKPLLVKVLLTVIAVLYALAAMIRLAYFNVAEEERQASESGNRKTYTGLPVTSAALIFPSILLFHIGTRWDLTFIYFGFLILVGFLFLSSIQVKKPTTKGILLLIAAGVGEAFALLLIFIFSKQ